MEISELKTAARIAEEFGSASDTGRVEVQVALFTQRIKHLTEHLKQHKKDKNSRRGMFIMIGRRKSLLRYLKRKSDSRYQALVKRLGLRR